MACAYANFFRYSILLDCRKFPGYKHKPFSFGIYHALCKKQLCGLPPTNPALIMARLMGRLKMNTDEKHVDIGNWKA